MGETISGTDIALRGMTGGGQAVRWPFTDTLAKDEDMKFISDRVIASVPIKDNGEKIVDLSTIPTVFAAANFAVTSLTRILNTNGGCQVREGVGKRLVKASASVPKGYALVVVEGYRSPDAHQALYRHTFQELARKNPDWPKDKLQRTLARYVAPPDIVPPHTTGGAVDVTLIAPDQGAVDMGTGINEYVEASQTDAKSISHRCQMNRQLLIQTMRRAGFINYPSEWWHWSYGDSYWAAVTGANHAIYGPWGLT
jgi:D-alanyl-D-alanine dipeptidase